ncbi:MAG: ATP-binding protein [Acidimicrobiia bacterium]
MGGRTSELMRTPEAPRTARRIVAEVLRDHGCSGDDVDIAQLLVSELVSNAVRHAADSDHVTLTIQHEADLVVAVADGDPRRPVLLHPDDEALGGRGVELVDALASSWGVTPVLDGDGSPVGKVVWFRLPC